MVQVEERYYDIGGLSAGRLNGELLRKGPIREGRTVHAVTDWSLRWSYVARRAGPGCVSASPSVELDVVTTLPRWTDLDTAPGHLVRDWRLYLRRLRAHEGGHRELAVAASSELLERLGRLSARDCDTLLEDARRLAGRVVARYDDRHAAFDRATAFGVRPVAEADEADEVAGAGEVATGGGDVSPGGAPSASPGLLPRAGPPGRRR